MEKFLVFIAFLDDAIYKIYLCVWMLVLLFLFGVNNILFTILLIILLLLILLRYILTENYNIKGTMFERKVKLILEKKQAKEKCFLINDCLFNYENEYTQIDNILVTTKAIFVVEDKNYSGNVYGKESDPYWTQSSGKYKNTFFNPIMQNKKHIKITKKVLNLFDYIPVYNIIVFSNNAKIKNVNLNNDNTDTHLVKDFDLAKEINYIERNLKSVIDDKAFQYIKDMLVKNNVIDKEKRNDYYKEIARKHINNY